MDFRDLIESHPEVLQDRHGLGFTRHSRPADIAAGFERCGVILLKDALPATVIEAAGQAFRRFFLSPGSSQAATNRNEQGSWHSPWSIRQDERFPAASVASALVGAWMWEVVENLCGSSHVAILLKWCMARHSVDTALGVGGHQDAKVVAADVPFSIWIPFNRVVPGRNSGLGFVVPGPAGLLPTLPHNDIGADYVLSDPARLWIPAYEMGDVSIHSAYSPHFTTGFGTGTDRFSLEVRAMARHKTPAAYLDPAIYVSRRGGIPTIVDRRASGGDVQAFLSSPDLAPAAARAPRPHPH
ncbi:hypothetical protein BH11PSE3_BH11PSE3_04120 [soil metagenome]